MKIGICGNFSLNKNAIGAQTIRTRVIYDELIKTYGKDNVMIIDTDNWKKNWIISLFRVIVMSFRCKNIIMLPAHNGVRYLAPLFVILKYLFFNKVHYIVIGGWLAEYLKQRKILLFFIKKIDNLYVQTETLRQQLIGLGLRKNIRIFPNFRNKRYLKNSNNESENYNGFNICIVSRINEKKGIGDAIRVISDLISDNYNIKLDIYGPIEEKYKEKFFEILNRNNSSIEYKGELSYGDIINNISTYDSLLFPTKYYTEGFPGTILDAFYAGLPIIASRWESSEDIVIHGQTGLIYDFEDINDMKNMIIKLYNNPEMLKTMKKNCLFKANEYTSDAIMPILVNQLR